MRSQSVILFDGVCVLCNRSVDFIMARDKEKTFSYLPLQSEEGKAFLEYHHYTLDSDTIVFYENGKFFEKSDAVLEIMCQLRFWKRFCFLKIVPKGIRDRLYDLIAKYRVKIFGRRKNCRIIK